MKKKIFLCLALVCLIVVSYFYANIDKNIYLYNQHAEANQLWSTGILQEEDSIVQTFYAKENSIDGVKIKVALMGNAQQVTVHCKLYDDASNEVAESSVSGSKLENNKFYQFTFPTVNDTKGRQYRLVLTEEGADAQSGVSFFIDPTVEGENNLVARTICHRFDAETFIVVLGMVAFIAAFMKILFKMFK